MSRHSDLRAIRRNLLRWYRRSARDLPWRRTRDPYRILVSEVMLQQTQVARVTTFYGEFLKKFPNVRTLASATPGTVVRTWRGLGYNMRALRLRALAVHLRDSLHGRFPRDVEELERLPGIGPYTARAVACFAFGAAVPVLETNVRRVVLRLFPKLAHREDLWDLVAEILPRRSAYDWNQALMELGSTICGASAPLCGACPLSSLCPSSGRAQRVRSPGPIREDSYRGQPRRIYRGRIVALLGRTNNGKPAPLDRIGDAIFPSFSRRDDPFLKKTLTVLELDGLVNITRRGQSWSVSLVR